MAPPSVAVLPSKLHPVMLAGPEPLLSLSHIEPDEKKATPVRYDYPDTVLCWLVNQHYNFCAKHCHFHYFGDHSKLQDLSTEARTAGRWAPSQKLRSGLFTLLAGFGVYKEGSSYILLHFKPPTLSNAPRFWNFGGDQPPPQVP